MCMIGYFRFNWIKNILGYRTNDLLKKLNKKEKILDKCIIKLKNKFSINEMKHPLICGIFLGDYYFKNY